MRFNRTSEYALKVFIHMVNCGEEVVSVKALHQQLDIPYKYLAALMRRLAVAGFLYSIQGKNGGYRLARAQDEIMVRDIIDELEGKDKSNACILGFVSCENDHPCPLHYHWKKVNNALNENIYSLSLADLVNN